MNEPMSNNIDYFIVCHDQTIIDNLISKDIKLILPNARFLLVGNQDSSHTADIIVCRQLDSNLEKYPYLCSFTAWYTLAKNNISKKESLCLLEYDVDLSDQFYTYHENIITNHINNQTTIAYSHTLTDHYVFYKSTPWLEIALKYTYDISLKHFVHEIKNQHPVWPTSTNMCMTKQTLERFVEWFLPMTFLFREDPLGSYVHERAFFIFCILNNIQIKYVKNSILSHNQQTSHQNIDIYGQVLDKYKTKALTQDMISEYDKVYEEAYRISLINCSK